MLGTNNNGGNYGGGGTAVAPLPQGDASATAIL